MHQKVAITSRSREGGHVRFLIHSIISQADSNGIISSGRPYSRFAAVLVLLYEKNGELRVLLTTRAKTMRSHPGQTALPGGKVDDTDVDAIAAAYREANEEVGLPLNSPHIHTLCQLRPFTSSSKLVVTPVVALLTDLSLLDKLQRSENEVDRIFDHPLEAILDPPLAAKEPLVELGSDDWFYKSSEFHGSDYHNWTDVTVPWLGNTGYRMHRFRASASPIKGLTAEILIMTASIAYNRLPTYEHFAPNQLTKFVDILQYLDAAHAMVTEQSGTSTPIGISGSS
ncbi:hypothetical protein QCA50_006215 [Cerrena zonata]|uniref:Nudix hydrolase domain-containing protein n=1 Tax=Cerrena zonata TaxID=2478898 RepID=A0AAW0GH66_9APHY